MAACFFREQMWLHADVASGLLSARSCDGGVEYVGVLLWHAAVRVCNAASGKPRVSFRWPTGCPRRDRQFGGDFEQNHYSYSYVILM